MPNYNVMDLAKRLSALERKILSTKQPTLNRSAIDGGAIQGMDDEGSLRTVIGEQFDGTHTVSVVTGPTPPTPTAPLLTPALGTVRTYWDGTFADGSMSPMDFRRVTVHAAPSKDFPGFDPTDQSTIIGTISTATGGEVTSALESGQEYVVQLFAWSQAGKFSQGSMAATVTPEGVDTAEIEAALAEQAKLLEANKVAAEKLVTDTKIELEAADLKLQGMISGVEPTNLDAINAALEENRQAVAAARAEVDAAETAITENSRLVAAVRADVLTATDAASGASQKATDAFNSAVDALNAATTVAGASKAVATTDAPADRTVLWIDTTSGLNTPKIWNGSSWAALTDKKAVDAAAAAATAQQAATSAAQVASKAVTKSVVEYAASASSTVAPASGWSTTAPAYTATSYVWMRTTVTYGDGSTNVTTPVVITGNPGVAGKDGAKGADGQVTYTWIKYADTPTGAGLSDSPTGKTYMGLAINKTTATESTAAADYAWSLIKGADGTQGTPGIQGPAGKDGAPTYTWVKYATSQTGAGLSDDPTGRAYIGLAYNKTTATESADPTDYMWALFRGADGTPGATGVTGAPGVSVASITPYWCRQVAAPAKPTTATPASPWQASEPSWTKDTGLWRTEKILFSNGSFAYTDIQKVASDEAASLAINSANGKNSITRSLNAPVAGDLAGRVNGDVWWRLDSYTANNVVGQWMVSGGTWVMQQIKSDVIANLDVSKLTATTASMDLVAATKMVGDFGAFKLLTADKLVVGSGANLVADPQFAAPDAWIPQAGWGVRTTGGRTSPKCLVRPANTASLATFAKDTAAWLIPVTPGQYRASVWVRASADTETAQVFITGRASAVAPQTTYVGTPRTGSNVTPNTTWQRLTWVLTIPEGNSWLRLIIQGTGTNSTDWTFSDLSVRPMASGELIVDGSVTASSIAANAVTAGKIAADSVTADKILADSSFANKVSGVIGTFKDVFSGSITTEMLNVTGSGKFSEIVVAGMSTFPEVWAGKIRGDYLSFDEGFFQKLKAGVAEFKSVTAGMITTNEIAAEAITSGKISVGAVDAGKIAANAVTSDTIAANAIDGKVMQGGDIYSPAKLLYPQVHVGGGVVEVIRNTPDDGPVTTISLGGLTDSVQIIDPATGTTLSSLNPDGTISSKGVSVDGDVIIRGRSIAGLVDAVDRAPQGIVAAYNLPGNSLQAGNTPLGIAEVNWVAQAGRMYRIVWDGYLNAPANNRVQLLFRMKIGTLERGASRPGVNDDSTIPASGVYSAPNAGLYRSHLEAVYRGLPGADYQARVLLVMMNLSSNSPVYASGYGSTIYVEDMGIGSFSGGYSASGGGTPYAASSADTTTAAPVAPPRTYTTTWGATWMTSLRTDGAAVSDALQQGYYAPNYRRSAIGFNTDPSSAGSIYKALAGASIQKVELYLKNSTFYSSSGGNANVDMSTLSTAPSSIGAITGRGLARNFKFAVGEGKWVTLNSDTWAGLKDGSTRSVVLGTTAGAADYARFSKADPPKIRITYVR